MLDVQTLHRPTVSLNTHAAPTTMLFEHGVGGHRGINLYHLLYHWQLWSCQGQLVVVTPPAFAEKHADVVDFIEQCPGVEWAPFSVEAARRLDATRDALQISYRMWSLFNRSARQVGAQQGLSMYLDLLLLPLSLHTRASCKISGIYFRPTFHYHKFDTMKPTLREQIRALRQKQTVRFALTHPQLQWIFSFDPLAAEQLQHYKHAYKYVNLPDPIEQDTYYQGDDPAALRAKLGIDCERKIFLLFGSLHRRKGVLQVLAALLQVQQEIGQKICLLLVGAVATEIKAEVCQAMTAIAQSTQAQVILLDRFVEQQEVRTFFALSDVILTTYLEHVGMSGVLLQAGAAGKPVLSTNYGLLGQLVKRHQLGLTVVSEAPASIAAGMTRFVLNAPALMFDVEQAQKLVAENSAALYAQKLLTQLGHLSMQK